MRRFGAIAFILVLAAVGAGAYFFLKNERLPAIGPESIAAETRLTELEALADQTPGGAAASGEALRALVASFDGFAVIEIGSIDDGPDGAVARNIEITLKEENGAGFRIDELRAWGVNENAAPGDRLADRLDARGVEVFGLETLIEKQMKAYIGVIESSIGEMEPEAGVEMDFDTSIQRYDVLADRIIVDGLIIHAGEAADSAEAGDGGTFMSVMKMMADSNRRASFDASVIYGMQGAMKMEQVTGSAEMTMTAPFIAASGWRRGDIDFSAMKAFEFEMNMMVAPVDTVDSETGEVNSTPAFPMQMGGAYDLFSLEDVKLARLYEYLAAGATPPTSDTDLLSLGVWRLRGESQTFGGREISSVEEAVLDLSNFHWLIPTDIRITARGGEYNLGAFFAYIGDMAAAGGAESDAAGLEQFDEMKAAFSETGLDVISYDMEMSGSWYPENGETQSKIEFVGKELGDWRQSFEGRLPNFEEVETILPADDAIVDWSSIGPKVLESSSLRRAAVVIKDNGGLDKGFAMAVAMAKLAPEDDAGAAMLRNADPADLRISSAAMIRLSAPQAAQAFPPAGDYIAALADFVQKGGVLRAEANPPEPFTAALLESEAETLQANPGRLAELLGLSVVREASAGSE